jgi:hypothetical protein
MPTFISINPFVELSNLVPTMAIQGFLLVMAGLVVGGVLLDIMHKKNVKYFFDNAKKAKEKATTHVSTGKKAKIIVETVAHDVLTSGEFCGWKRRVAHLLGMYGTIIFWVTSAILVFNYATPTAETPVIISQLWHIGAVMTCLGAYWFWFFLRVDVAAEGHKWYRVVFTDLFVLSLVITSTFGLAWSYLQVAGSEWNYLFLVLFVLSNIALYGGVYWSKFAHMFYKPGAAIQKHLAEADGSRDSLPMPADAPEQFGLGIKREAPRHY